MLDDAHFQRWFGEARDGLVRYAYLCCGDRDLAEELVAEAVARLWPSWRSGRVENPDGYVRRIIANKLTDRRRRAAVKRRIDQRSRPTVVTPDPADGAIDELLLWPLVLALPPAQRAVIVLRYYEARTEAEIARMLDVAPGTVKSRAARGLDQLRAQLEEVSHG